MVDVLTDYDGFGVGEELRGFLEALVSLLLGVVVVSQTSSLQRLQCRIKVQPELTDFKVSWLTRSYPAGSKYRQK